MWNKMQILSLSSRPKTLDEMVGQKELVSHIRGHFKERIPQAWMFVGETGCGKTTLARILALTLQCRHQERVGNPCPRCQKNFDKFDIVEVNAGDIRGVNELEGTLDGYNYAPKPGSKNRVYILDEAQMLSGHAQSLMLKYLEDCPRSTYWIICTTDPHKIKSTIHSRCVVYKVPILKYDGVQRLVRRALEKIGSKLDAEKLYDALNENQITSPRRILMAVEKYTAGMEPEAAARISDTELDTHAICRNVIAGDWEKVARYLKDATGEDVAVVRAAVAGYMKAILLGEVEINHRTKLVAKSIEKLVTLGTSEDGLQIAGTVAVLHNLCQMFSHYRG